MQTNVMSWIGGGRLDGTIHLAGTMFIFMILPMDPGINGVETLRQIRQISPKIPAILVSGYAKPSDVAAAQAIGAGAYLIKPVSSGMLATEVRRALDTHG